MENTHSLDFAKIVATPTLSAWSQVYNAGKLFSILSLRKNEPIDEELTLGTIGKEVFKTLEEEYFTLPEKNLESIRQAVVLASEKIPTEIKASFLVASIVNNILYVFIKGEGRVEIKRGEKTGIILKSDTDDLKGASGFLENEDSIIIQTEKFSQIAKEKDFLSLFDNKTPSEVAELISPKVHELEEGEASAVIINFKGFEEEKKEADEGTEEQEEIEDKEEKEEHVEVNGQEEKLLVINTQTEEVNKDKAIKEDIPSENFVVNDYRKKRAMPNIAFLKNFIPAIPSLSHKKRVFLSISLILVFILVSTFFISLKNKQDSKNKKLFNQIYNEAEKKYDEGHALLDLNQNLAEEELSKAKKILEDGKTKFKENSEEQNKIKGLLAKIDSNLSKDSESSVKANKVDGSQTPLLKLIGDKNSSLGIQSDNSLYYVNEQGIMSEDGKLTVKKDWENIAGAGAFFGNFYVLDKSKNQIYKFVKSGDSYSKSDYLTASIDLSKANDIAIDGAIWVVLQDGSVIKFFRGAKESFSVTGLDKPISSSSRIFTNADTDNLYILDKGNQRIVALAKDGKYVSQYKAGLLKNASALQANEKDKKTYVLVSQDIYEIPL